MSEPEAAAAAAVGGEKIRCTGCGAKVRIPLDLERARARCPRCHTPLDATAADRMPESIGAYKVLKKIAKGGMGAVYEGVTADGDRHVAIKILLPEAATDENIVARFQREGALGMALKHPYLVEVIECGRDSQQLYMVMELVHGLSLSRAVKRSGPMPWQEAIAVLGKAAEAQAYINERGVIHRDLKPGNILLGDNGAVKITDLGLARCTNRELFDDTSGIGDQPVLTLAGDQLGTPSYMAPEQVADSTRVGPTTDVYGLGATLFFMLTARVPFEGRTAIAVMDMVSKNEPPRTRALNPAVPPALDELVDWCLAKEPEARPASCAVLVELLRLITADADDVDAVRARRRRRSGARQWSRLRIALCVLLGLVALALLVVAYLSTRSG